ncbi:MAG: hypothetical protein J0M04_23535 [Verrucomicrobia bacterium]|nr:hypothetical protein [Verrucomicrobiota bacterium]MBN8460814.1 hypothetical protein [Verrucomicrobiota bacterium]
MNSLTAIFLSAMLWLTGPASGDIAMLHGDGKKETLIIVQYEGTAPHLTAFSYTFTSGRVVVAEDNKQIGEVVLTADEQTEVDRYCKFMKNRNERSDMRERHRIRFPEESNAMNLPLADYKKRATKEHKNSVEQAGRGDGDRPSN